MRVWEVALIPVAASGVVLSTGALLNTLQDGGVVCWCHERRYGESEESAHSGGYWLRSTNADIGLWTRIAVVRLSVHADSHGKPASSNARLASVLRFCTTFHKLSSGGGGL